MSRVIAVVGPPSAGVSSLAAVLAERLPDHEVLEGSWASEATGKGSWASEATGKGSWASEATGKGSGAADAVVVVASAVAPLAESDVDVIERTAAGTDLVIAAVSKVDAHRGWRGVLAADRALLARRDERYRQVPWVGVAAAPDLGEPNVDDLVDALLACLAKSDRLPRARLPSRAANAGAVRAGIQRARLTLAYFVRRRCAEISADLRAEAAELPRGGMARFGAGVRDAAADFGVELDAAIDEAIEAIGLTPRARSVGPTPQLPHPRPSSRRLETRLMLVLGGGFGLGVALTLGRVVTQLGPGSELIGLLVGGVVGLLLTIWVVGIRGVLHDRALADRWVSEVMTAVRNGAEETVARRILDVEIVFARKLATHNRPHGLTLDHGKRRNSASESFL